LRSGGGAALSTVDHHAEILRSGPAAWNAWRKKRPATIPHLSGVVLAASERELGGIGGAPINLKSARLQEAVFRFATLSAANLQAADLSGADLVHARFHRANLSEANLHGAALDHADFSGADLRHAALCGSSLRFTTLEGADLEAADLSRADLAHARLAHASLAGTNLRGAVLDYADFAGADLSQADLSGARLHNVRNLTQSQLERSIGDAATILPSHLRGCVPWSAAGEDSPFPVLDAAQFWLLQARQDLGKRAFYRPTARVAGIVLVGAVVATGFVSETAHDTLSSAPVEAQRSIEPSLSMLPAADEQSSALSASAAATILESAAPPSLPTALAEPALPPTATPEIIEPATVRVPSQPPEAAGELLPQAVAAIERQSAKSAEDTLAASRVAEELIAPEHGTVFSSHDAIPVTLALASAKLSPLKPRQSAVPELRTRRAKIPMLAFRKPLRLSVVLEAHVIEPEIRALDGAEPPVQISQQKGMLAKKQASPSIAAPSVSEPLMLVVSLDAQKIDIYRGVKQIASAKISSGMPGYDTRTGVFSILEKKRRHHSNLYSGAQMPFMQRLTRSGTALHAGAIPGYPASHGCVRLPYSFAPKLFEMTKVGENVVVTRSRPVPRLIEHPNLFELPPPKPQVAMAASVAVPRLLSDAVAVAAKSGDQDRAATAFRSDAPLRILVTRRTAHDRVIAVQYMLADMGYLPRQKFTGKLGTATGNAVRAFQRANGLPETGGFTDELAKQVYKVAGKPEPPEGHLFMRQDFNRVFDVPIIFRNPEVSLGTHVLTVVKGAEAEAKAKWMAVSLEGGDAAHALDRIQIPDEVRRSIAPRLRPGSTLIIGDKSEYSAILPEGGDFLVSTEEPVKTDEGKVEQAGAGMVLVTPVKVKHAKPRAARASAAAKPRMYTSYRREIRRRYISRPSPFGMPYLFGR
jgi:uncharacterized protein YjbI with pentapeptide repeats/lipoprotein-anchoring transpeptidase ErfK/SrfK/peptidoglycan hydrolase-like protein with peptidoglycan-binding domain